jgi:hypothetical protein
LKIAWNVQLVGMFAKKMLLYLIGLRMVKAIGVTGDKWIFQKIITYNDKNLIDDNQSLSIQFR